MTAAQLPPQVTLLAGQVEDQLSAWADRDPAHHHPDVRRAGERATHLLGDLIAELQRLRDRVTAEVGAYDDERRGMA